MTKDGLSCRQFCNSGCWSAASGPLHRNLSLEKHPEVLPLVPLKAPELESVTAAKDEGFEEELAQRVSRRRAEVLGGGGDISEKFG